MALPPPARGLVRRSYAANLPVPTLAAWNAPRPAGLSVGSAAPEGVGAYVGTGIPMPGAPRAYEALSRLGVGWVRTEIPWAEVEPVRGSLRWGRWDRVIDGLRARNYRVLGLLCYWPGGVTMGGWLEPYSDAAIREFGRYCEHAARRYRGRVAAWEVWNEPNEPTFWQSTPERYAALLRAAFTGIRRGDPDALVIGGSLSGVDLVYLDRLFAAGAAQWMDALSVHPYTFGWKPEESLLIEELRGAAAAAARAGVRRGLWVTEIGARGDGLRYADLLERTCILMRQSDAVEAWFWHALHEHEAPGYGLHRQDWSAKPAAARYAELSRRLEGARAAGSGLPRDLTPPWAAGLPYAHAPLQAWCFRRGAALTRAAWAPSGSARSPEGLFTSVPSWSVLPGSPP